jgi:DNA invertase Pin-like site-specific DNA recombinase
VNKALTPALATFRRHIMGQSPVPAAQYLRMSTDHQQYSLDNQADAIARYAEAHGFVVVKTFSDEARSGLSMKRRNGLKRLLKETVEGHADFKAILVYDVSRWGRFQDADEAAHYEFLCKSSGAPV